MKRQLLFWLIVLGITITLFGSRSGSGIPAQNWSGGYRMQSHVLSYTISRTKTLLFLLNTQTGEVTIRRVDINSKGEATWY